MNQVEIVANAICRLKYGELMEIARSLSLLVAEMESFDPTEAHDLAGLIDLWADDMENQ